MPFQLNDKLKNLVPYDPVVGQYPIRLDANESFLPIGDEEREAIVRAAQETDLRRYPDHEAVKLCQAAGAWYWVKPGLLTAWNGTDEAILLLCAAFLGQGKALLSFTPDFSMYHFYAYLSGADCIQLPKRDDFSIDVDTAIAALRERKPDMLLFSNPCNPTSLVLPREDTLRLVEAAQEAGALAVVDEAYMDFCGQSLLDDIERFDNLVILRTCSKAAGIAGLRLGFSAANPTITRALRAAKSPYNVGALTQAVGTALLCQPLRLQEGVQEIRKRTDGLSAALKALGLPVIGDAANFVFVRDAAGAFEYLKERGIIVRQFGAHLRITTGSAEENAALISNLEQWMAENRRN
ncbi:MAG: histidinol-phosphate aminotransferase family protein [Oscillospiraceae bacterium]|nr:histidinol-phosphate aminotransferase family protein [Oscillospiraceae bacterium]